MSDNMDMPQETEEVVTPEAVFNEVPSEVLEAAIEVQNTPVELSKVEKVLLTLQEGLVQIGALGRDQSNLVIEAANKVREAVKAIQEDARI